MTNINQLNNINMDKYQYIFVVSFNRTNQLPIYSTYSNYIDALNDINQQITNISNSKELNPNLIEFSNNSTNGEYYKFQITDFNGNIEHITLLLNKTILNYNII